MALTLESSEQLEQLLNAHPRLLISSYRGDWCPFCRLYLKQLENHKNAFTALGVEAVVAAADSEQQLVDFQRATGNTMTAVSDPQLLLEKHFDVPVSRKHPKAKSYAGGGFLQPAILIFEQGKLVYAWRQNPKVLNLGGAIARMSVKEVLAECQRLFGDQPAETAVSP